MPNQTNMKFRVYDTLKQRYVIDPHLCVHAVGAKDGISEIRAREPAVIIEPFTGYTDIFGEELYANDVVCDTFHWRPIGTLTAKQEQVIASLRAANMIINDNKRHIVINIGVYKIVTSVCQYQFIDMFFKAGDIHDENFRSVKFLDRHYVDTEQRLLYDEAVAELF